ncbi:hypothetical protein J2X31_000099 [Flavobacterium arsenatis]|uniref:Secretion system C-terminal sorting domain-containing protein n=1 Tax=Flavobacterium arsenatis TaxID=1484332 RepID=A0ABU1TJE2_9FLAO|nr:T9SS type A sorting domain-containing protein [Flavobacterium arsenatis]MDR6966106.1 hypothetical protein [Flavobacterium arsenatis]
MKKTTLGMLFGFGFLATSGFASASNIDPTKPLKKATATFATSNDNCATAMAITEFPFNFFQSDGADAANDGISTTCLNAMNDGLWFTVEGNGNSIAITVTPESDNYDIQLGIFNGSCGALSCVGVMDVGFSGESETYVIGTSEIGTTYYINVGHYHPVIDQPEGNFTINVTSVPTPVNDNCAGAIEIVSFPYTNEQTDGTAASTDGFVMACENWEMNDGLWYTFTGDGSSIEITVTTGEEYDISLGVFTGTCENLECVETVDDTVSGDETILIANSVMGTVYYINVGYYDSFDDAPEGNFTINLTSSGGLGTNDKEFQNFTAYPNPVKDVLNLSYTENISNVEVFNLLGQKMLAKSVDATQTQVDLSGLSSGSYLVKVTFVTTTKSLKVVKQ